MSIERAIEGHLQAKVARLREMGFEDDALSKAALEQVGGNVNLALEKLISGGVTVPAPAKEREASGSGDARGSGAGGGGGGSGAGGGNEGASSDGNGGLASIFSLPQRASSASQAGVGRHKARSRPTASAGKPARAPSRAVSGSVLRESVSWGGFKPIADGGGGGGSSQQGSKNILPIKRDREVLEGTESGRCSHGRPASDEGLLDSRQTRAAVTGRDVQSVSVAPAHPLRFGGGGGGANGRDSQSGSKAHSKALLAEQMRPNSWKCFVGQENVRQVVVELSSSTATLPSLILWGPPGCV